MVVVVTCCFLLRRLLLCCDAIMVWAVSFLVLPLLRMLTAVDDREKKLGHLVWEMQTQMEDLVLDSRLLQEKLRAAHAELEATEALLDEMEEEHEDDGFATIHALDNQENARLNEHKGKGMWDDNKPRPRHGEGGCHKNNSAAASFGGARGEQDAAEAAEAVVTTTYANDDDPAADDTGAPLARAVARRRSLFSLGMSLAVGAVAWSADAPCLPLLAGLFAVVGVSMRSVSRLPRRAAAADAVALLSLNWFLLGVLTSPMLPGVAHAVVPRAGRVLGPALTWIAAAAPL